MLSLFLQHILISLTCLGAGFLCYHAAPFRPTEKAIAYRPLLFYPVSGLIGITGITQLAALFMPIGVPFQAGVLAALCALLLLKRRSFCTFLRYIFGRLRDWPALAIVAALVTWLLIVLLNAGPTVMDDTESYHIQMVKWIREYGSVPGLVHLHERYGFNSSWFSSIAFFSVEKGHLNFYTGLNGVLSVWFAVYLLSFFRSRQWAIAGIVVFFLCFISWPLLRANASTSNYDYISMVVIFGLFAETVRHPMPRSIPWKPEWLVWPAFLFTVRIMNFPLLLLSLAAFVVLLRQREYRRTMIYTSLAALLVIAFLARNVILSGYFFYPSMAFDWMQVDWKADRATTLELLRFIKYYNRVSGSLEIDTVQAMGAWEWPRAWLKYMFGYDKLVFIPGAVALLLSLFIAGARKRSYGFPVMLFLLAILLQLIAWLLVAPDPRFIYGCLLAGIFLVAGRLRLPETIFIRRYFFFCAVIVVVAGFTVYKTMHTQNKSLAWPVELPAPALQAITVDSFELYIPGKVLNNWNPRCYDTKLPCVYRVDPRLRARGASLKDGFRLAPR